MHGSEHGSGLSEVSRAFLVPKVKHFAASLLAQNLVLKSDSFFAHS